MYLCGLVISLWIEHGGTQLNKWQAVVEPLHAAWQSTTRRQVDRREQRTLGENCLHWLQAYWRATKVQSSNKKKPISIECSWTTPLGKSYFYYLQADWGATQVQGSLHNQHFSIECPKAVGHCKFFGKNLLIKVFLKYKFILFVTGALQECHPRFFQRIKSWLIDNQCFLETSY